MKKYTLVLFTLCFNILFIELSSGHDLKGLSPNQPNGIFSTFSTATTIKNTYSLSFELERSLSPDFTRIFSIFSYGASSNIDLNITVPYQFNQDDSLNSFEDSSFGIKHRFIEEGQYLPSIAYIVSVSASSGKDNLSTDGKYGAGIILTKKIGPFRCHSNLFYFHPDRTTLEDEIDFLIGFDLPAANDLDILTEIATKSSHTSQDIDSIEGRFGYRYKPNESLYTTLGMGRDFKKNSPELRLFLSFTLIFPKKGYKIKQLFEDEDTLASFN